MIDYSTWKKLDNNTHGIQIFHRNNFNLHKFTFHKNCGGRIITESNNYCFKCQKENVPKNEFEKKNLKKTGGIENNTKTSIRPFLHRS